MNPRITLLTDELISSYTEGNVLTDYRDINLKVKTKLDPYPGGIYDPQIFGSMFQDRCNCGNIRTPGIRCPRCNTVLLDEVQSFKRFGRIECPVYYSNKFKVDKLIKFLKSNFRIIPKFTTRYFEGYGWTDSMVLDVCQWNWSKEDEALIITDEITDFMQCSYEGLIKIMQVEFPQYLEEVRSYLNQYVMVIPMALRAPIYRVIGESRVLENNYTSVVYQNILYCVHEYYPNTFPSLKEEIHKAFFRGCLRKLISKSVGELSQLLNSSKENLARNMQSNQLPNSGRCVIVPDPTLKADEVVIPRHLMYETCREEFTEYIAEKKKVSQREAEMIYKTQYDLDEIQKLFDEYIEGDGDKTAKRVIINRAPSLYELGMAVCKVKLTYDYVMKIPQVLCTPLNADYDGDAMPYYSIPKKMNELMDTAMSPRNVFRYKKNHMPLYTPNHEMMHGLIIATKVNIPNKLESFDTLDELKAYKKENPDFKYQTMVRLSGKKTTLGRAILSDLFDKDLDAYLGEGKGSLNSKNIILLYEQLIDKEDRLERIQKIQEFALKLTTLSGSTAPRISELYLDIDKKYLDKIKEIENNPKLNNETKESTIRVIYQDFQKEMLDKIPEGIRTVITESSRADINQLRDMAIQQLNVGPERKFNLTETTLVAGMAPLDYKNHAIENRAVQDIKQLSVPMSGYVTRQFIYLASEYGFEEGVDEENAGIEIREKDAEGRTRIDGTIVEKSNSDKLIKVRSVLTSTKKAGVITGDMLTNKFHYKPGSRIGMALISSLTESLTQGGLALKHTGNLYSFNPGDTIEAPEDGTLKIEKPWILFEGKSKTYKYPLGDRFADNYAPNNFFKKGEIIGRHYNLVTPSHKLDSIIKLCSANTVSGSKSFSNNKKILSDCYARTEGPIKYDLKDGDIIIKIGDEEYWYNPECLYFYPEGTHIKKYQRICTGTLHMKHLLTRVTDYLESFKYFKLQFDELLLVSPELIEFLYVLLAHRVDDTIQMRSVVKNIKGSESFFKSLAFGYASKSFKEIGYGGEEFISDPITSFILSLIMNNKT